jgi:hypothetical protein
MKKLASILAGAALLLAAAALNPGLSSAADSHDADSHGAQTTKRHKKPKDPKCDRKTMTSLTWEEAQQCFPRMKKEKFDAIDANKDSAISKEEMKAYRAAHKKNKAAKM